MREIEKSSVFKKDFKRIYANPIHRKDIDRLLLTAIDLLLIDADLPKRLRDHGLIGACKKFCVNAVCVNYLSGGTLSLNSIINRFNAAFQF